MLTTLSITLLILAQVSAQFDQCISQCNTDLVTLQQQKVAELQADHLNSQLQTQVQSHAQIMQDYGNCIGNQFQAGDQYQNQQSCIEYLGGDLTKGGVCYEECKTLTVTNGHYISSFADCSKACVDALEEPEDNQSTIQTLQLSIVILGLILLI